MEVRGPQVMLPTPVGLLKYLCMDIRAQEEILLPSELHLYLQSQHGMRRHVLNIAIRLTVVKSAHLTELICHGLLHGGRRQFPTAKLPPQGLKDFRLRLLEHAQAPASGDQLVGLKLGHCAIPHLMSTYYTD